MVSDSRAPGHGDDLSMFILDVLQHDVVEQVSSIIAMLNDRGCIGWREFWAHDFMAEEVIGALKGLVNLGLVRVLQEDTAEDQLVTADLDRVSVKEDVHSLWFARTDRGIEVWDQWNPPT